MGGAWLRNVLPKIPTQSSRPDPPASGSPASKVPPTARRETHTAVGAGALVVPREIVERLAAHAVSLRHAAAH